MTVYPATTTGRPTVGWAIPRVPRSPVTSRRVPADVRSVRSAHAG